MKTRHEWLKPGRGSVKPETCRVKRLIFKNSQNFEEIKIFSTKLIDFSPEGSSENPERNSENLEALLYNPENLAKFTQREKDLQIPLCTAIPLLHLCQKNRKKPSWYFHLFLILCQFSSLAHCKLHFDIKAEQIWSDRHLFDLAYGHTKPVAWLDLICQEKVDISPDWEKK